MFSIVARLVVVVFMVFTYRRLGWFAVIGLLVNLTLLMGVMALCDPSHAPQRLLATLAEFRRWLDRHMDDSDRMFTDSATRHLGTGRNR